MAQQVLAAKPKDQGGILGTHMVERELMTSSHMPQHAQMHSHVHIYTT